ncbi:MAG: polysaccharide biosynthesis tyrosine autokinase [Cyanobacteria bacterium P01_H01_bin.26]
MQLKEPSDDLNVQKYLLVLKRRWLIAVSVFMTVSVLSVLSVSFEESVYRASGSLLFKSSRAPSLTGIEGDIGELDPLVFGGNPLETQAEIIKSLSIAESVIEALGLKNNSGEPLSPVALVRSLQVSGVSETADVLSVAYKSPDPERAAAIVNQVMEEYIRANLLDNRAEATTAREFIESNLPGSEATVRAAEGALQNFRESNGIVALDEEADAVVDTLKGLERGIVDIQAQLANTTTRSNELSEQLGLDSDQGILLAALGQSTGVQELLTELQTAQSELATERTRFRDNHPTVIALARREAALTALLQERVEQVAGDSIQVEPGRLQVGELQGSLMENLVNLEIERLGLIRQLEALADARQAYVSRASVFPNLEQTQARLERDLESAIVNYNDLLERLRDVRFAENQNLGNARIIERAFPPLSPIPSRQNLISIVGAFCGLLLGIAVAFTLDLLDGSVKTVQEAQAIFRYPLLGLIPRFSERDHFSLTEFDNGAPDTQLPALNDLYGPVAKAFQSLYANIKSTADNRPVKIILLTSTTAGEGTSTVAAHLAATIAQTHRKVLLIDAQLTNSNQHNIWKASGGVGLSDLLSQKMIEDPGSWQSIVQPVAAGLSLLPAGQRQIHSLEAFDSPEMSKFIYQATEYYDFIVIDAPPLLNCADASVLGQFADRLVLVVDPKEATVQGLEAAGDVLGHLDPRVLGFVANRIENKAEADDPILQMKLWHLGSTNKQVKATVES